MASDLLIGASSLSRQDLAQRYLDTFQSRKDSFERQLEADIKAVRARDRVDISSSSLVSKAEQLVVEIESLDAKTGPIFKAAANITEIIDTYENALEQFTSISDDEDVRAVLDDLLQSLQPTDSSPEPSLTSEKPGIDETA